MSIYQQTAVPRYYELVGDGSLVMTLALVQDQKIPAGFELKSFDLRLQVQYPARKRIP
jgi:hypothetical protein